MAAAALVYLRGGSPEACGNACAMALKNLLGLVCDPVAGLVEVPWRQAERGGRGECHFLCQYGVGRYCQPDSAGRSH